MNRSVRTWMNDLLYCKLQVYRRFFSNSNNSDYGPLRRDGTRSSPFLVPRGPGPFFTPRFHEEYILSLLGSLRTSKIEFRESELAVKNLSLCSVLQMSVRRVVSQTAFDSRSKGLALDLRARVSLAWPGWSNQLSRHTVAACPKVPTPQCTS